MSQFRRRLLMMMQKAQDIWRDVVMTGTGLVVANDTTAGQSVKIFPQGWTEQTQYEGKNLCDRLLRNHANTGGVNNAYRSFDMPCKPNTTYTATIYGGSNNRFGFFSGNGDIEDPQSPYSVSNGKFIPYDGKLYHFTVTTTETDNVMWIYLDNADIESLDGTVVQVEEGYNSTPHEPYTGGKPSPNPDYPQEIVSAGKYNEDTQKWEYEVKLTGKNLLPYGEGNIKIGIPYEIRGRTYILNKDGSITITTQGSSESSTGNIFIFGAVGDRKHYKLPAGKYTVSTFNGNIPNMSIQLEDENGVNTRSVSVGKFELKEHERIAYAWLYGAAGTEWNGTIYPQLEYGGVSTSYEQYKLPQTVTLTSDHPLTKWDKLEKRNGQWGWVYKSMEIMLDGSEKWDVYTAYEGFFVGYMFDTPRLGAEGFCESFICETAQYSVGKDTALWLGQDNYNVYAIRIPQYNEKLPDSGLQDWKDWLSENPITILTYADEETFIPLSESEQDALNALRTYYPTTVFSNDQNGFMQIEYRTKYGGES